MALLKRLYRSSDGGAVIIIAAVGLLVLMGFVAFAADYGVFWTARGQAQNAADSAAMAAATSWAFDVPDAAAEDADPALVTLRASYVRESAVQVAKSNLVWNAQPAIDGTNDVFIPPDFSCPGGAPAVRCFRVNVYRDSAHSNALPVFFSNLFGVTSQNMKATATGGVLLAGASDCLAPFSLPDRWQEVDKPPFKQDDSKFKKYDWDDKKGVIARDKADIYVKPGPGGTGYKFTDSSTKKEFKVDDLQLKFDKKKDLDLEKFVKEGVKAKAYIQLEVPRRDKKESIEGYEANFATCNGQVIRIGDFVPMLNTKDKTDQTELNQITLNAINALYELDPTAVYKNGKVNNSCAQNNPPCAGAKNGVSPRVVNIALFDPDRWTDCMVDKISCDAGKEVQLVNISGFFVDCDYDKKKGECKIKTDGKFKGSMMPALGLIVAGPPPDEDFSFLRAIGIIR
jgi:hypothetical protein